MGFIGKLTKYRRIGNKMRSYVKPQMEKMLLSPSVECKDTNSLSSLKTLRQWNQFPIIIHSTHRKKHVKGLLSSQFFSVKKRGGRERTSFAMSLFKELLDPQHRRRRTRGPIEYTDVEAAESLHPQRQLAMLMRDVSGAREGFFWMERRWVVGKVLLLFLVLVFEVCFLAVFFWFQSFCQFVFCVWCLVLFIFQISSSDLLSPLGESCMVSKVMASQPTPTNVRPSETRVPRGPFLKCCPRL